MSENKQKGATQHTEVKIGGGTYLVERVFDGSKPVESLIATRVVAEKQKLDKERVQ